MFTLSLSDTRFRNNYADAETCCRGDGMKIFFFFIIFHTFSQIEPRQLAGWIFIHFSRSYEPVLSACGGNKIISGNTPPFLAALIPDIKHEGKTSFLSSQRHIWDLKSHTSPNSPSSPQKVVMGCAFPNSGTDRSAIFEKKTTLSFGGVYKPELPNPGRLNLTLITFQGKEISESLTG